MNVAQKNITIIFEEKPLGTAGSIDLLPELGDCNLIVTNCDILTNLNLKTLINFHLNNYSDCTLSVSIILIKYLLELLNMITMATI